MSGITIECSYCSKLVEKSIAEVNRLKRRGQVNFYCNNKCSALHSNAMRGHKRTLIKCKSCNSPTYNKKFCSRSCAATYNNVGKNRHQPKETLYCAYCNTELTKNQKYCNFECSTKHRSEIAFENNVAKFARGINIGRGAQKKIITEKYGYACEICKINEWNNKPITLQVDHIDGDSDNNMPDNLRLLCPNCHSQTETYKGGNKRMLKQDERNTNLRKRYAAMRELELLATLKESSGST